MSESTPWGTNLSSVTDDDSWAARPAIRIREDFPSPISDDWLADAPRAFDTRHNDTARLVVTNRGVSPVVLGSFSFTDLQRSIPTGYTDLSVVEKRAVIVDGRIARLWPQAHEPAISDVRWTILIPDDAPPKGDATFLGVSAGYVLWHGLRLGCSLSRLMNGRAVLLVRGLESHYWH